MLKNGPTNLENHDHGPQWKHKPTKRENITSAIKTIHLVDTLIALCSPAKSANQQIN